MQNDLEAIKDRNARVEADKAWETSATRRLSVAALTYLVAFAYMTYGLGVERAFLHAAVPAGGYLLSTVSLGKIRSVWLRVVYRHVLVKGAHKT
jgi:hypothetical protein